MIQRYKRTPGVMLFDDTGRWVRHDDHERALAAERERGEKWKAHAQASQEQSTKDGQSAWEANERAERAEAQTRIAELEAVEMRNEEDRANAAEAEVGRLTDAVNDGVRLHSLTAGALARAEETNASTVEVLEAAGAKHGCASFVPSCDVYARAIAILRGDE